MFERGNYLGFFWPILTRGVHLSAASIYSNIKAYLAQHLLISSFKCIQLSKAILYVHVIKNYFCIVLGKQYSCEPLLFYSRFVFIFYFFCFALIIYHFFCHDIGNRLTFPF